MSSSGNRHKIQPAPIAAVVSLKKKRNLPGMPDPDSDVIALSPTSLLETNRFVCEVCGKGFQRDQNLQLHRRGHNLPWKLKQRHGKEAMRKRVYVCPELTCVHHNPSRALGDLTGIKKHFCRKHGEKKWKCERCPKKYAVLSDWKAHMKTCGTREYKCHCGTVFSRRDSFTTHRAFCEALTEENVKTPRTPAEIDGVKVSSPPPPPLTPSTTVSSPGLSMQSSEMAENPMMRFSPPPQTPPSSIQLTAVQRPPAAISTASSSSSSSTTNVFASVFTSSAILPPNSIERLEPTSLSLYLSTSSFIADQYATSLVVDASAPPPPQPPPAMSATALLQKAAVMGASASSNQSFLYGLGLAPAALPPVSSSSPSGQEHVKTELIASGSLGLELPSSGPATLDLLGLGLNAGTTTFGSGFSLGAASQATAYGGGSSSGQGWDGGPGRKSKGPDFQ